ncbi:MAG: hypothetical protein KAS94_08435 [Desulfobulbaceae bacterium]|nr:hypothetical protein [Desulfobulbaceae bacterium]
MVLELFAAGASGSGLSAEMYLYDYQASLYDGDFLLHSERRKFTGHALHGDYQMLTKYAVEQAFNDLAEVFFNPRTLRMMSQ